MADHFISRMTKGSPCRVLSVLLLILLVVLGGTCLSLYTDLQKYREIGEALTTEEKSARYFYEKYRELGREQAWENEHARMCLGIAAHMGWDDAQAILMYHMAEAAEFPGGPMRSAGLNWGMKAALQGKPEYEYRYARCLALPAEFLEEEERDEVSSAPALREAFVWLRMSAAQGYGPAARVLSRWYASGIGCEKNPEEAARWGKQSYEYQRSRMGLGYVDDARFIGRIYMDMERPDLALPYLELGAIYGGVPESWQEARDRLDQQRKEEAP